MQKREREGERESETGREIVIIFIRPQKPHMTHGKMSDKGRNQSLY